MREERPTEQQTDATGEEPDASSDSINIAGSAIGGLIEFIHIRLSLLGIEVREAKKGLILGAILLFAGAFFFLLCWAGISVAAAAIISQHYQIPWPKVVLGIALLHAVGGVLFLLIGKRCFSKANFRDSLNELERDRQWLARYRKKN